MPRVNPEIERLEWENSLLRKQLEARRQPPGDMPVVGCGDHSCLVAPASGMGTNGGCHCELHKVRWAMMWWKRKAEFLEETIREMRTQGQPIANEPLTVVG